MKSSQVQRIAKHYLLDAFPGFRAGGKLFYAHPVGDVLQAFCFDDSDYDRDSTRIVVFVLPLYVPRSTLAFTFGHRLQNRRGIFKTTDSWLLADPPAPEEISSLKNSMTREGIPFLEGLKTPQALIRSLKSQTGLWNNVFVEQAIAFSYAKIGERDKAVAALRKVVESVKPSDSWQHVRQSSEALILAIHEGNSESAMSEWRRGVIAALGLQSFTEGTETGTV